MRAAEMGKSEAVAFLLDRFSDQINIDLCHQVSGYTSLMYAATKNHSTVVTQLIDAGADLMIRNKVKK